jgi:hypothetical protein
MKHRRSFSFEFNSSRHFAVPRFILNRNETAEKQVAMRLVILSHLPSRLIPIPRLAPDDPFINRFLVKSPDPSDTNCWDLTVSRVLTDSNLVQL